MRFAMNKRRVSVIIDIVLELFLVLTGVASILFDGDVIEGICLIGGSLLIGIPGSIQWLKRYEELDAANAKAEKASSKAEEDDEGNKTV